MWIIRWIVIAIVILFCLFFAFENQGQTVSVEFIKWKTPVLPLYIFLYISFGLGMLFWLCISALNILKLKGEIHRLHRENRKIVGELNRMRNVSIEEEHNDSRPEEDDHAVAE